jgi:hypothetical protein
MNVFYSSAKTTTSSVAFSARIFTANVLYVYGICTSNVISGFSVKLGVAYAHGPAKPTNAIQDRIRFLISLRVSGKAALNLYSTTGANTKTIYRVYIEAGKEQIVEYSLKDIVKTNFIYRLQVGGE